MSAQALAYSAARRWLRAANSVWNEVHCSINLLPDMIPRNRMAYSALFRLWYSGVRRVEKERVKGDLPWKR